MVRSTSTFRNGIAAGLFGLWFAPAAFADDGSTFNFLWENDAVAGTDHHYTNGLEFSWLSIENHLWDWFREGSNALPGVTPDDQMRVGVSLGQIIFTPDDTEATAPLPEQRPYAGWLYGGVAIVAKKGSKLDTWALNLGVVGPSAGGEDVQNGFHRHVTRDDESNGWDNQLVDTFGYQLVYERRWQNLSGSKRNVGTLQLDFSPHLGVSLGNVGTYANGGISLRLGKNLAGDFGVPRIRPSLPGSAFFTPDGGFDWYVFAGIDARAVAYNIFLEGDAATYDVDLDKETFVYDAQAGLSLMWPKFRFAYTYVIRSKEFEGQSQPDRFGSIAMTYRF